MLPRPIIVFDGEKLPAKAKEDQRRGQLREAARLRALELLQQKEKGEEVDDFLIQQKCQPYADLWVGNWKCWVGIFPMIASHLIGIMIINHWKCWVGIFPMIASHF